MSMIDISIPIGRKTEKVSQSDLITKVVDQLENHCNAEGVSRFEVGLTLKKINRGDGSIDLQYEMSPKRSGRRY